ncbi:MAG TPA: 50S ribosomal protein L23 [Patescibacteria group bacterium]|jgi:large subunit ribosomal protein L23|nr:50S ribosomal protein L23 [Patescibacteria group bacterium]
MNIIHVTPRATEKAYRLVTGQNTYVFDAPLSANKQQIIDAVESQYAVKVARIKTLVQSGKAVRFARGKHRYPGTTTRTDSKKAYVTLVEGDSIKVFDETTETEEKK